MDGFPQMGLTTHLGTHRCRSGRRPPHHRNPYAPHARDIWPRGHATLSQLPQSAHLRRLYGERQVSEPQFLPGVPATHVLARLAKAGGNEIQSGKLSSHESSAALAVNCFGWFIERPGQLPPLPGLENAGVAEWVEVEFCARFPWAGGRHPWLDAVVQTETTFVGIESKRFEPFRDAKTVSLSDAYNRRVWGGNMKGYERMRDRLRSGGEKLVHLDAAQLVKHAFGLVTEGGRRKRKPVLFISSPNPRPEKAIPLRQMHSPDTAAKSPGSPNSSQAMKSLFIRRAIGSGSEAGVSSIATSRRMQTQSWNFSNRNIVGKPCGFISVTLKGDGRGASAASFEGRFAATSG